MATNAVGSVEVFNRGDLVRCSDGVTHLVWSQRSRLVHCIPMSRDGSWKFRERRHFRFEYLVLSGSVSGSVVVDILAAMRKDDDRLANAKFREKHRKLAWAAKRRRLQHVQSSEFG